MLDAAGLGRDEAPYRIVAAWPGAQLRAYAAARGAGPVLLIIPAPFKRAYIWDLMPAVSVVRRCLARGCRVYLLDWIPPTAALDDCGLAEYALAWPRAAVAAVREETGVAAPILAGHSLGGTLAAIFAAAFPTQVGGLVLADAPLAFGAEGGPLGRAVARLPPARQLIEQTGSPLPGTAINALCAAAAPDCFQGQRWADAAASAFDAAALATHLRVERWALDEFPLPARLFEDILEQLYREDAFRRGTLKVGRRRLGLGGLRGRAIAVVNPPGLIVPPASVLAGLAAAPRLQAEVLTYDGDHGPVLQHLGPLVGRSAHARLWPRILTWIDED